MKKRRLWICTGKWSIALTAGYMLNAGEMEDCEDICFHVSPVCDENYLNSLKEFALSVWSFSEVRCINHCTFKNAASDNIILEYSLLEKPENEAVELFIDALGGKIIDEVFMPHFFAGQFQAFVKVLPLARVFSVEEGLNTYFRKYNIKLNAENRLFLSRLHGHISYNFFGVTPLFDFPKHGVPLINPGTESLRRILERCGGTSEFRAGGIEENAILFLGQVLRPGTPKAYLKEKYLPAITGLLGGGFSVYYKRHPRDVTKLADYLQKTFEGAPFFLLEDDGLPAECIVNDRIFDAVVSLSSTALVTIPAIFNIPAFMLEEYQQNELLPGKDDFENGINFCASVTPALPALFKELHSHALLDSSTRREIVRKTYSDFPKDPNKFRSIYMRKQSPHESSPSPEECHAAVRRAPYASRQHHALSKAYARSGRFFKAMGSGVRALQLNPLKHPHYAALAASFLRFPLTPFFRQSPFSRQWLDKTFANSPFKLETLTEYALHYEHIKDFNNALKYRTRTILLHPWYLFGYFFWLRCFWRKFKSKRMHQDRNSMCFKVYDSIMRGYSWVRSLRLRKKAVGRNLGVLAYRADEGATGGPGGVLFVQKMLMGATLPAETVGYHFKPTSLNIDWYEDFLEGLDWALDICAEKKYRCFIVHDLGSAYALALARQKYVLVWHQQGSYVTELLGFGRKIPAHFGKILKKMERLAFSRAESVHFPSAGAYEMYCQDPNRACERGDFRAGEPLYNTILPDDRPGPAFPLLDNDFKGLTFISVGSLTAAKGQDQVLSFFASLLKRYPGACRWICIGDGVLASKIYDMAGNLTARHTNFSFIGLKKAPHEQVLGYLQVADIYIMLQRISIFDFATLEAMRNRCAVFLSRLGGNIDFDTRENITFIDDFENFNLSNLEGERIRLMKDRNFSVFTESFSPPVFWKRYYKVMSDIFERKA